MLEIRKDRPSIEALKNTWIEMRDCYELTEPHRVGLTNVNDYIKIFSSFSLYVWVKYDNDNNDVMNIAAHAWVEPVYYAGFYGVRVAKNLRNTHFSKRFINASLSYFHRTFDTLILSTPSSKLADTLIKKYHFNEKIYIPSYFKKEGIFYDGYMVRSSQNKV